YCTKDEAMSALTSLAKYVAEHQPRKECSDLFENYISELTTVNSVPKSIEIAKWLKENRHDYFVKLLYRTEEYETMEPKKHPLLGTLHFDYVAVRKERDVVDSFELTVDSPYLGIKLEKRPRYENLPWWNIYIVPVFSKVALRLFFAYEALK